jgi:putative flippase GtrA
MPEILVKYRQVLMFLLVGASSAAIDVGLLQLMLYNGASVLAATSLAFVTGLAFNFVCHARYTFTADMGGYTLLRYLCVVALNYLLTLACVGAAVALGWAPVAGKIVSMALVPLNSFLLGKHWIFKQVPAP